MKAHWKIYSITDAIDVINNNSCGILYVLADQNKLVDCKKLIINLRCLQQDIDPMMYSVFFLHFNIYAI